ncbi:MAG: signal peptide peptidase SppA [Phycisphaeraceae bacterium]|nr:signal peptide peptidase SppA [Phycisphaeraceae bacterium]
MLTRVVTGLVASLLLVSLLANFYLGGIVYSSMSGPSERVYRAGSESHRVVILPIEGMIDDTTASFVRRSLDSLAKDPPAALVLRVNSGGGLVSASDQIWHALKEFKNQTNVPVVASFGAIAASGGYYVAAPADRIMAEQTTITGSIGVIAQAFTVERLLDKIGVTPEIVTSDAADQKDMLNPMRSWTEEDRAKLRTILNAAHQRFVDVVADGRSTVLSKQEVEKLATGEVFTAGKARDKDLVDSLGYLDDAVAEAAGLANVPPGVKPKVTVIREPAGLIGLGILGQSPAGGSPDISRFDFEAENVRSWLSEMAIPRLEYRWYP